MAIEIRIVIDPFAFRGAAPRERTTEEDKKRIRRGLAIQREREEQHRQRLIEMGLIPPPSKDGKD